MAESLVAEKMKRHVYLDYPDYKDEPFSTSKRFGVYIPKLNDEVSELIQKHEYRLQEKENQKKPNNVNNENIFHSQEMDSGDCGMCQHDLVKSQVPFKKSRIGNSCGKSSMFQIKKSNMRADESFYVDPQRKKRRLHGYRYGWYLNEPYSTMGSTYYGSRFYQEHGLLADYEGATVGMPVPRNLNKELRNGSNFSTLGTKHKQHKARSSNPVMNAWLKTDCPCEKDLIKQEGIARLKETGLVNVPDDRMERTYHPIRKVPYYGNQHLRVSRLDNTRQSFLDKTANRQLHVAGA